MKKAAVFISGPYSGDVAKNVREAMRVTDAVIEAGYIPLTPHLFHYVDELWPRSYQEWLAIDKALLFNCADCVLRMEGPSPGADEEVALARAKRIPVFYSLAEIKEWASEEFDFAVGG